MQQTDCSLGNEMYGRIGLVTVEQWMTPASTSAQPTNLERLVRLLRHGGFDHLPVVSASQFEQLARQALIAPTLIRARVQSMLMLEPHTPLWIAARLLVTLEAGGLGVADQTGDLIGVITALDVMRALVTDSPPIADPLEEHFHAERP